jgi:hypothetical protein
MHLWKPNLEGLKKSDRLWFKAWDGQDAASRANGSSAKEVNWPI